MAKVDITKLRKRLGDITQAELAEMLGVNQSTIWRWENGGRKPSGPAAILLAQIAKEAT
jgi:DNA-binding transcriptional regulator YiaG